MNPQEIVDAIVWEDLPPAGVGNGGGRHKGPGFPWAIVLWEIRKRPGEWAKLPGEFARGTSAAIQTGTLSGASPGEFEARIRNCTNQGKATLYVRYVGGES